MARAMERTPAISVIGDGNIMPGTPAHRLAREIGRLILDMGYILVTGGQGGVMEAACRGARESSAHRPGTILGILPGNDPRRANPFVDVALCTGIGHARNVLVAHSDAVVAIGGGAGTLSEMAMAWIHDRLIVALRVDGWSGKLAGTRIDGRRRAVPVEDDQVFAADTVEDVKRILETYLPVYLSR